MSWKQGPWWCARCARFGNRFVVVLKCVSTMHDETMRVCVVFVKGLSRVCPSNRVESTCDPMSRTYSIKSCLPDGTPSVRPAEPPVLLPPALPKGCCRIIFQVAGMRCEFRRSAATTSHCLKIEEPITIQAPWPPRYRMYLYSYLPAERLL